jgi:ABC-2 type transport system permease protein
MRAIHQTQAVLLKRNVLWTLVIRDLRVRYSQSVLGYVWTILDPLMMSLIYFVIFVYVFRRNSLGHDPYFLFLVAGLLPWQWFSGVVQESSRALIQDSKLVRSTNLPREIWVARVVLSKGVEYVLSLPVLVFFSLVYALNGKAHLNGWLVLLPLGIVVQFVLLVGIGLILAPVTALVNDMQRVINILVRMLFYMTPVIYTSRLVPAPYDKLTWLNPMTGVLEMMRAGFFTHDDFPILWGAIVVGVVVTLLTLLAGFAVFGRLERSVLKEI